MYRNIKTGEAKTIVFNGVTAKRIQWSIPRSKRSKENLKHTPRF
jgi:hypothetical protein